MRAFFVVSVLSFSFAACAQPMKAEDAAECARLQEEVKRLDAHARNPLSAQEQQRIRQRRKVLRNRQFQLRC
jgi:hypothetical protein